MLYWAILLALPSEDPVFAPLEKLVGRCWSAQIAAETIDRHCFRQMYGDAHVRDEHTVLAKGLPVYSGETIYSVEKGSLVFTYFSSLGGIGRGTVTRRGDSLYFRMSMRASPRADVKALAVTWRFNTEGYDVISAEGARHFRLDGR